MSGDIPSWASAITASFLGAGGLGQAVKAIYRDLRADRLARAAAVAAQEAAIEAARAAQITSRDARIAALEAALAAEVAAHRATISAHAVKVEAILTDINGDTRGDVATLTRAADALTNLRDDLRDVLERLLSSLPPAPPGPLRAPTPPPARDTTTKPRGART